MNKIMGLDLGARTCGVALSDTLGFMASPVTTVRFEEDDYEKCCQQICEIIDKNKVEKVILGLPKHMNGDVGVRGEISQQFKEMLEKERAVQVILWDERLTTVSAQKNMIASGVNRKKRREMIDAMAAVVILQSYLDSM